MYIGKLAALNRNNCEEHPRSNLAQNSNVARSQECNVSQLSEENERRVKEKLSQPFGRTENRLLGALSRLDDFQLNWLFQGHSGTLPETSQISYGTIQGTNGDDHQSDPHPKIVVFQSRTIGNSGPQEGHDIATRFHEEVTYFSPKTFSGKQKENCSSNTS